MTKAAAKDCELGWNKARLKRGGTHQNCGPAPCEGYEKGLFSNETRVSDLVPLTHLFSHRENSSLDKGKKTEICSWHDSVSCLWNMRVICDTFLSSPQEEAV